ncbi:FAD-dependent monooxygenase [Fodinicola acaciae]|uniref:FAD-dependent monooxygenase n=1 Tax=Fodinicola acaciae TaxID=2681555 RepID=UPI0013D8B315|nr:FAD-dependent monooxygenase [Fodinicola acaciae]
MSIQTDTFDVVICGAGPTGLLVACELALAGARPVVLDRRPEPSALPKANGIIGQPVRLLAMRGLLNGQRYMTALPAFPFGDVPVRLYDCKVPGLLMPQPELEALLARRATELAVAVRRGHELVDFQHDETVHVTVSSAADTYTLSCGYLVGCDGGRSVVRERCGIGFPGSVDPEVLRLGHFRVPTATGDYTAAGWQIPGFGRLERGWNRTAAGAVLAMSLQPGVLIVGIREPGTITDDSPLTMPELHATARRVIGAELPVDDPIWLSRVVTQSRLADRYRDGRVFVAGDAAHLFPAGGALTVCLADAANLGWKLAAALRGRTDLLDTYESERRPVAARALAQTKAQAALSSATGPYADALRTFVGELVAYDDPRRHVGRLLDGSDVRYPTDVDHQLAGTFVPNLPLDLSSGRPVLVNQPVPDQWRDRVDAAPGTYDCPPMLVRPDGYVAWAGEDSVGLQSALAYWFDR